MFRLIEFPPSDAAHMHRTATLDYAMVLTGEIYAVLDTEEKLMREGDVLIQRGTNHAWRNDSDNPCRMLFVLLDAEELSDLATDLSSLPSTEIIPAQSLVNAAAALP